MRNIVIKNLNLDIDNYNNALETHKASEKALTAEFDKAFRRLHISTGLCGRAVMTVDNTHKIIFAKGKVVLMDDTGSYTLKDFMPKVQVNESSQTATSQLMGEIVATRVSIGDISVTTSVVDEFIRILRS